MLKLYHHFLSPQSRSVWIALIEKKISCEIVTIPLKSSAVPVIEEDSVEIAEALAILNYLESRYPTPALLPNDAPSLAIVQMIESAITQFEPAVTALLQAREDWALHEIAHSLTFLEHQLGNQQYFGGDFTRADIVAGVWVTLLPQLGLTLDSYPYLKAWAKRLTQRPSWRGTQMRLEALPELPSDVSLPTPSSTQLAKV